jgi:hypothetical protein
MNGIILKSSLTLLLSVFLISCTKQEVQPGNGEKIAQDLRAAIGDHVLGAAPYEYKWDDVKKINDWVQAYTPTSDFVISGSFISIGGIYFNLNNLEKYYINGNVLYLYFTIN